jgi:hypothetical protein
VERPAAAGHRIAQPGPISRDLLLDLLVPLEAPRWKMDIHDTLPRRSVVDVLPRSYRSHTLLRV